MDADSILVLNAGSSSLKLSLFREGADGGLALVLRAVRIPWIVALLLATGVAAANPAAHHVGPYGEPFEGYNFLFRTVAGVYFALLFQLRGFGIAVGAHACYDVVVGVGIG